jgi:hypothetical protein
MGDCPSIFDKGLPLQHRGKYLSQALSLSFRCSVFIVAQGCVAQGAAVGSFPMVYYQRTIRSNVRLGGEFG